MIIPVRCFTCNKVVGDLWKTYQKKLNDGEDVEKIFEYLGVKRYCCKTMLLTNVDIMDKLFCYEDCEFSNVKYIKRNTKIKRIVRAR